MNNINITSAQYRAKFVPADAPTPSEPNCAIMAVIDGVTVGVPLQAGNRHYTEIMRQVDAGELTIADAD
jgi:hypothetical protein